VLKLLLLLGNMSLSHLYILIDSEVWNWVIFWWTLFLHFLEVNSPFMSNVLLSPVETVEGDVDISISSKVWNEIVHWVWGFALILCIVASSSGANWIRLNIDFSLSLEIIWLVGFWNNIYTIFILGWFPCVLKLLLRVTNVLLSHLDISVKTKVWNKVVFVILGSLQLSFSWWNPLVLDEFFRISGI